MVHISNAVFENIHTNMKILSFPLLLFGNGMICSELMLNTIVSKNDDLSIDKDGKLYSKIYIYHHLPCAITYNLQLRKYRLYNKVLSDEIPILSETIQDYSMLNIFTNDINEYKKHINCIFDYINETKLCSVDGNDIINDVSVPVKRIVTPKEIEALTNTVHLVMCIILLIPNCKFYIDNQCRIFLNVNQTKYILIRSSIKSYDQLSPTLTFQKNYSTIHIYEKPTQLFRLNKQFKLLDEPFMLLDDKKLLSSCPIRNLMISGIGHFVESIDVKNPQFHSRIYIIHKRGHRIIYENIYKVGKTTQLMNERMRGYEKGSEILFETAVTDANVAEKLILEDLRTHFVSVEHDGAESFRGDWRTMRSHILTILNKNYL